MEVGLGEYCELTESLYVSVNGIILGVTQSFYWANSLHSGTFVHANVVL